MSIQEGSGQPLVVGDFVKFPNPSTTSAQAFLCGVYCGANGNYAVVNVPTTAGGNTMYRSVVASTVIVLVQVNGPANGASNK